MTNAANQNARAMNAMEMTSVRALMAYTAYHQKVSEETVREIVSKQFDVSDLSELSSQHYDDVVRFLVDIQVDMLMN